MDSPHFGFRTSTDGYLGCFHFGAIMYNAAMHTGIAANFLYVVLITRLKITLMF